MRFFLVLALVLTGLTVQAKTTVYRKGSFLYFRMPYKEWQKEEQQMIVKRAVQIVVYKLAQAKNKIDPDAPINEDTLYKLELLAQEIDEFQKKIELFVDRHQSGSGMAGAPTAFYIFGGFKAGGGLKVTGGAATHLGYVCMPYKFTRVDLLTRKVDSEYKFDDCNIIIMGNAHIGLGAAAPSGGGSAGIGFIWGEADKSEDLVGAHMSIGKTLEAGIGIHVKAGVMRQWGQNRYNPFASIAFEKGPIAEASVQGNLGFFADGGKFLQGLFGQFETLSITPPDETTNGMIEKEFRELEKNGQPLGAQPAVQPTPAPSATPAAPVPQPEPSESAPPAPIY